MKSVLTALFLLASASAASADAFNADVSTPVPVENVCSREFKSVTLVAACWDANGSSSKQFGSEGGSDGSDSGDGSAE